MRDNCCNHHVENNDDDISITLLSQMSSRSSLTFDFSAHHSTSRLCLHQILMTCLGRAAAGAWIHGFLKVAKNHQILNMQQWFLIFELQFQQLLSIRLKLQTFSAVKSNHLVSFLAQLRQLCILLVCNRGDTILHHSGLHINLNQCNQGSQANRLCIEGGLFGDFLFRERYCYRRQKCRPFSH